MKVWVVSVDWDAGIIPWYSVDKVFLSETLAKKYAKSTNQKFKVVARKVDEGDQ